MEQLGKQSLLDANGNPLSPRIQDVMLDLRRRFQGRFPTLNDDLFVTQVLEEAGQNIEAYEQENGQVNHLSAYAWQTVLNVARSRLRSSSMRLAHETLPSDDSDVVIGGLHTAFGTVEQVESKILVDQLLARMTEPEQILCVRKQLGFSSREIAQQNGMSVAAVDTLFYRIKRRFRSVLEPSGGSNGSTSRSSQERRTRTA
jgi:DNA-directed RNA polymerase specialized sigma24 family protein